MVAKLVIEKDTQMVIAELRDDGVWACADSKLEHYLNSTYSPRRASSYLCDSGVEAVNEAADDLRYGGYQVSVVLSVAQVVDDIVYVTLSISDFWSQSGWPPPDTQALLARSRLDRQVSLSHCLRLWLNSPAGEDAEGQLILAWVNLRSLVEGAMKLVLTVWEDCYSSSPVTRGKNGKPIQLDALGLEELKNYFKEHVWTDRSRRWDGWISKIQQRGNAIHAYKDRDIGSRSEFFRALIEYREFLGEIDGRLPYPGQ
nr:hypothetical protein fc35 [uncultured bacterium]